MKRNLIRVGAIVLGLGFTVQASSQPTGICTGNASFSTVTPTTGGSTQALRDLMTPVNTWITSMTGLVGSNPVATVLPINVGTGASVTGESAITAAGTGCNVNDQIGVAGGSNQGPAVFQVDTLTGGAGSGVATMHMIYGGWYTTLPSNPATLSSFGAQVNTCASVQATLTFNAVTPNQSSAGVQITGDALNAGSQLRIDANGFGIIDIGSHDIGQNGLNNAVIAKLVSHGQNSANSEVQYTNLEFIEGNTTNNSESARIRFRALGGGGVSYQEMMIGRGLFVGAYNQSSGNPAQNADGPGLGKVAAVNGYYVGSPSPGPGYSVVIDGSANGTFNSVTSTTPIAKAYGGTGSATGLGASTNLSQPYVVCNSNTAAPVSPLTGAGANVETNFATCTITGNAINLGSVEISSLWQFVGTAGTKEIIARLSTSSGSTSGAKFLDVVTSSANLNAECLTNFYNRATNSQIGRQINACGPQAASANLATGAIDTTQTTYINFNGLVNNTADSIQLQSFRVTIYPVAGN